MIWYILSVVSYFIRELRRRTRGVQHGTAAAAIKFGDNVDGIDPYGGSSSRFIRRFSRPERLSSGHVPLSYYDPDKAVKRGESFVDVPGFGKSIAILTSGGDSQGKKCFKMIDYSFVIKALKGLGLQP